MKVVFMGTPAFAVPALERLIDSPHEVCLVVTQPDRPRGRGRKVEASPVKALAEKHGLRVIQPQSLKREPVAALIRDAGADVAIVAAYGRILPPEVLQAPRLGCLNIHPSLLPEYRGAAPIQRAILDGRGETGVTIMLLAEELDNGPIIAQQRVDILDDDDALSVSNMTAVLGADMLIRVLDDIGEKGAVESVPQDDRLATFAPPIAKEEGQIPWGDTTMDIMYRLRAMTPWPGAYTYVNGRILLHIVQAEPLWENEAAELGDMNKAAPGTVSSFKKGFGFTVRTGDGHLLVTAVKPGGKKLMDAPSFVNGRGIQLGDVLGPAEE
ncbi:MAG: methionyl-tRNA formyltransferase [bacterium]|nr:methionyl-tRNA formyltransferase [bacterium]